MKTSWITEGTTWMSVMERQDQSLRMLVVPQPMEQTTFGLVSDYAQAWLSRDNTEIVLT